MLGRQQSGNESGKAFPPERPSFCRPAQTNAVEDSASARARWQTRRGQRRKEASRCVAVAVSLLIIAAMVCVALHQMRGTGGEEGSIPEGFSLVGDAGENVGPVEFADVFYNDMYQASLPEGQSNAVFSTRAQFELSRDRYWDDFEPKNDFGREALAELSQLDAFDEDFFADHDLLYVSYVTGTLGDRSRVAGVWFDGRSVHVCLRYPQMRASVCMNGYECAFVPVEKRKGGYGRVDAIFADAFVGIDPDGTDEHALAFTSDESANFAGADVAVSESDYGPEVGREVFAGKIDDRGVVRVTGLEPWQKYTIDVTLHSPDRRDSMRRFTLQATPPALFGPDAQL